MKCPKPAEWIRLSLDSMDSPRAEELHRHLRDCPACKAGRSRLASDEANLFEMYARLDSEVDYEEIGARLHTAVSDRKRELVPRSRRRWSVRRLQPAWILLILLLLTVAFLLLFFETSALTPFLYPFF